MDRVVNLSFKDNFIKELAGYTKENIIAKGSDISRLAFVFEGKRPSLVLKKELANILGKGHFSPAFFSIDEFVEYIAGKFHGFRKVSELEACFMIYNIARKTAPSLVRDRDSFSRFMPWAGEIRMFIDQLDLEGHGEAQLPFSNPGAIGNEVPAAMGDLLNDMQAIRKRYHEELREKKSFSRGMLYRIAARDIKGISLNEFDNIFICNVFCVHRTEKEIVKTIFDRKQAVLFYQGDKSRWPVLGEAGREFGVSLDSKRYSGLDKDIHLYSAFDTHSQAATVRELLKKQGDLDDTVCIIPDSKNIVPLMSEMSSAIEGFNISMGYEIKRSPFYSLFSAIFRLEETKKRDMYYTKDYLRLMSHPFIKNFEIAGSSAVTRILVHKIEELLRQGTASGLSGRIFLGLDEIIEENEIYSKAIEAARDAGEEVEKKDIKRMLKKLHDTFILRWGGIGSLVDFAEVLEATVDELLDKSVIKNYPLDVNVAEKILSISDDLRNPVFKNAKMSREEIYSIFRDRFKSEMISFSGSPLKGLQVLGLFESRCLNFKNVYILDANESVLPKLRTYEPLIPRELMLGLNLARPRTEEQIQRYHFFRMISYAKNVHIVYEENNEKEKSRFVEEIIWRKEKEEGALGACRIPRVQFDIDVLPKDWSTTKTKDMVGFLKNHTYSASSIDMYVKCPLRFYYRYVLGLKEKEDLLEDVEASSIGQFIHKILEDSFGVFKGKPPVIDDKFKKRFFSILDDRFRDDFERRMKADAFTFREILKFRLARFLEKEEDRASKVIDKIICLEKRFADEICTENNRFRVTSIVDRIDLLKDKTVMIVDYKSGAENPLPAGIDKIRAFSSNRSDISKAVKSFQLPLYIYVVKRSMERSGYRSFNACLYYLRNTKIDELLKSKDNSLRDEFMDVCMDALKNVLDEIIDPEVGFRADDTNPHYCGICPYINMCK